MKRIIALLLVFAVLTLCAACGKKTQPEQTEPEANAVLTDSAVPLDIGAELIGNGLDPDAAETKTIPIEGYSAERSSAAPSTTQELRTQRIEGYSEPNAALPEAQ